MHLYVCVDMYKCVYPCVSVCVSSFVHVLTMLDEPVCVCSLSCDQAAEGDVAVGPCVLAPAPPAAETPAGPAP